MSARKPFKGVQRAKLKNPIEFPCGLSFKIDGFRCMNYDGQANSSSGKLFPNKYINSVLNKAAHIIDSLDSEICVGNPWDKNLMQQTSSGVTSEEGEPEFHLWVFDDFSDLSLDFDVRYANYQHRVLVGNDQLEAIGLPRFLRAVEYRMINSQGEYDEMQCEAADIGYEGLYGKKWKGKYKHGRSTPISAECWKDKPWTDAEAVIIDFIEMETNLNEAFIDELGRTKRSTVKDNMVPNGHLGSYVVESPDYEKPFNVSCGTMTMAERLARWAGRESERGQTITFKFFDFGVVDVPRSALYKSHRPKFDLAE